MSVSFPKRILILARLGTRLFTTSMPNVYTSSKEIAVDRSLLHRARRTATTKNGR